MLNYVLIKGSINAYTFEIKYTFCTRILRIQIMYRLDPQCCIC